MSITKNIHDHLDNNELTTGVFIHLRKVFETADHGILLKNIDHYEIRELANHWFLS